ncbi:hypothetical protein NEUTE1DRAFT_134772 [Neurospora tetrasperma FGSC 2508]|uniref:Uncharacterized protein n=1 Tax=Neurospora tetrasperma (strain FGSC 2508 / ATCC MYA-4615 / P0657) TaxID=510951 RepID=F8ME88_NEUT8|nr:uncharacterized protein NEUTE1DRAFT_134772 [Neurospora tetrasperma FGSC 2508]EGO60772.1 hypothetical protein NEUTE1DRAFT_134772 [Neurospora tetrasperma FGSC 2508]
MDTRTGLQSITSPEGQVRSAAGMATREAIKVTPLGETTGVPDLCAVGNLPTPPGASSVLANHKSPCCDFIKRE